MNALEQPWSTPLSAAILKRKWNWTALLQALIGLLITRTIRAKVEVIDQRICAEDGILSYQHPLSRNGKTNLLNSVLIYVTLALHISDIQAEFITSANKLGNNYRYSPY